MKPKMLKKTKKSFGWIGDDRHSIENSGDQGDQIEKTMKIDIRLNRFEEKMKRWFFLSCRANLLLHFSFPISRRPISFEEPID